MKKPINRMTISGRIYDHTLAEKTSKKGEDYIGGNIDVATDDAGVNIVTVHYIKVTEITSKGNKNATYTVLKKIIDEGKTIITDGFENATMVNLSPSLGLNDFYSSRTGEEVLVSAKRNQGGFANIVNKLKDEKERNRFECDMLINGTRMVEADPENNIDNDYLIVKGAVFDYRGAILPGIEFVVKSEGGIRYFESLDASPKNLVFTKVWGNVESQTVINKVEQESAFGEAIVKEYSKNIREYVITGSAPETYEIGDEQTGITTEEIKKAMADREVYLAEVKARQEEYQASRAAAPANAGNAGVSAQMGGFNF